MSDELIGQQPDEVTKISKSALRSRRAGPAAAGRDSDRNRANPPQLDLEGSNGGRRKLQAENEAVAWDPNEEEPWVEPLRARTGGARRFSRRDNDVLQEGEASAASAPVIISDRWGKALNAKED